MGVYADDKILKDVIHAKIDEILINDEFMKEAKKKDVKPVFKFESLPGDVQDHLFIEYNEEKLFREMSNEVQELCQTYNTHLDVAEVWYNAKKVVHTLRDINRPELLIQRAAVALAPGQMYNGFEGSQIILLCVYMMICESPNHEYFSNFITKMEYEESSILSDMQVIARNLSYMKRRYNEKGPYDGHDYIGETALKQETYTRTEAEHITSESEENIQPLQEEKNKEIDELEKQSQATDVIEEDVNWHNKVCLELLFRLMKADGMVLDKRGNKATAARIMQAITNLPISTCKNYCSNQNLNRKEHEDEIVKLNFKLQTLGMKSRL